VYLGKYFCSACQVGDVSVIPAHAILHWNLAPMPVSRFSADFIEAIRGTPLFDVESLRPAVFSRLKWFHEVKVGDCMLRAVAEAQFPERSHVFCAKALRQKLFYLHKYLSTCKLGSRCVTRSRQQQYVA
jgi:hypothetical protein